jgi:hypothetical protein
VSGKLSSPFSTDRAVTWADVWRDTEVVRGGEHKVVSFQLSPEGLFGGGWFRSCLGAGRILGLALGWAVIGWEKRLPVSGEGWLWWWGGSFVC